MVERSTDGKDTESRKVSARGFYIHQGKFVPFSLDLALADRSFEGSGTENSPNNKFQILEGRVSEGIFGGLKFRKKYPDESLASVRYSLRKLLFGVYFGSWETTHIDITFCPYLIKKKGQAFLYLH